MPSRVDRLFSNADRDAIRDATTHAEGETAGEIVVYVVDQSDPHPEIAWKAALLGGALGTVVAALLVHGVSGWGAPDYLWVLIGLQLGALLGWLGSRIDEVGRRLITEDALEGRVEARAAEAFVEEEVFATAARTGVLIFVSVFEHRVLVVADEGVRRVVPEEAWTEVASGVAAGIARGEPTTAIIDAVKRCAGLMTEHGIPANQTNELSNIPRFRDE